MIEELVKQYRKDVFGLADYWEEQMLAQMDLQRGLYDYLRDCITDGDIVIRFEFYGYMTRGIFGHYEPFKRTKVVECKISIHKLVDMLIDGCFEYTKSLYFSFSKEGYPVKSGNIITCCGDLKEI